MDVINISNEIEKKIKKSEKYQKRLVQFMKEYKSYDAFYDKEVGINILNIKNGQIKEWEGRDLSNILGNANLIERTAKAMAWETKMKADTQDKQYRVIMKLLDNISDNQNGFQSINRHLDIK
jgi:hypothetical protein